MLEHSAGNLESEYSITVVSSGPGYSRVLIQGAQEVKTAFMRLNAVCSGASF